MHLQNKNHYTNGYCLVKDKEAALYFIGFDGPRDIQPTVVFWHCPDCGILSSMDAAEKHIWNPSNYLLERLNGTKRT